MTGRCRAPPFRHVLTVSTHYWHAHRDRLPDRSQGDFLFQTSATQRALLIYACSESPSPYPFREVEISPNGGPLLSSGPIWSDLKSRHLCLPSPQADYTLCLPRFGCARPINPASKILTKTSRSRINQSGSICLRHLGEV